MSERQLTFDGREVSVAATVPGHLSPAQRAILRAARITGGQITTSQAGKIMHAGREDGFAHVQASYGQPRCCDYCSSDGSDALKRLRDRGLVRRVSRGLWEVVQR